MLEHASYHASPLCFQVFEHHFISGVILFMNLKYLSLSMCHSLILVEGSVVEPPKIVPEAEILSVGADDDESFEGIDELGEFSISRIINQHAAGVCSCLYPVLAVPVPS